MNLLFYFDHPILPHAGGTERAAYLLAQALSRHGHRVSFLSLRGADSLPADPPYFLLLLLTATCFLYGRSARRSSVFTVLPQVLKSFRSRAEK